ncbi:Metal-dependent hydrolase, endonuclease/exonuclease/phosphatase family [Saccharopolyspora kobensis]|uniref:Metal-dependent hydrolase, endonuclease/exonuclease/phosphatase family n=1 Tax=Saccharopolyspora kobensis TaxID=146035 RepID=A0A1H6E8Z1_9PSEU|nr:endonuclease/exonuclease/phosphatase family protein [Saccharopolyspora kobensis]SEG93396.1 Metal-dependent hydrolase, endonuclease/exonuclease/phosphatase family [Saccharopolyspora kobensis]SFD44846.1 Metal-dependent hydrolase, endonuclease/exonuclease/phosphatase family [Saccharopolyspora kobensis]
MSGLSRRGVFGLAGAAAVAGALGTGQAVAAPAGVALIGPAKGPQLHVMSFNIRTDTKAAPPDPDSWRTRRPILAELLGTEQPTVLGVQEALYTQVKQVLQDIPPFYDWIGLGREGGGRGEFMSIYYDTRRLEPLDYDHFWLSDTPSVIGSKSWGNNVIRMVTAVRFHDRRSGREFVHVNTHFDHRSEPSRQRSAQLVRERIAGLDADLPVVLTGDFNTPAGDSESYRILTSGGLADTWTTAQRRLTPAWGTFGGYKEPVEGKERIDWILHNDRVAVRAAAINDFRRDGHFPSDHLPVQALIDLR